MRRRLIYHGRVQGVGFRYTVRPIARRHPVIGWVKNLPEGTVELVVEAEVAEMAGFLEEVAGRFEGQVDSVDDLSPSAEPLSGVSIRHWQADPIGSQRLCRSCRPPAEKKPPRSSFPRLMQNLE